MTVRKAKCHEADGEPTQRQTADVHELLFTPPYHPCCAAAPRLNK